MPKLTLKIENMMCENCVAKVTAALDVDGVKDLKVREGRATLTYDPAVTSEEELVGRCVDAGYPAKAKKGLF